MEGSKQGGGNEGDGKERPCCASKEEMENHVCKWVPNLIVDWVPGTPCPFNINNGLDSQHFKVCVPRGRKQGNMKIANCFIRHLVIEHDHVAGTYNFEGNKVDLYEITTQAAQNNRLNMMTLTVQNRQKREKKSIEVKFAKMIKMSEDIVVEDVKGEILDVEGRIPFSFNCCKCESKFVFESGLHHHMQKKHKDLNTSTRTIAEDCEVGQTTESNNVDFPPSAAEELCPKCGFVCSSKDGLRIHIGEVHLERELADQLIEISENFESNLQDKNEEEKGDEEEEEKEDKSELEDSEEKGKAEEEKMDELAAKEDIEKSEKNDEKRQRKEEEKEKENEPQEFDDNQTDAEHGKDEKMEEPEAFDLPDNMELDEKEAEDNFEEAAANEPEMMPDFEDENDEEEATATTEIGQQVAFNDKEKIEEDKREKMLSFADHSEDGFKCKLCGKMKESEKGFSKHMAVKHETSIKFPCKMCEVPFPTADTLQRHMSVRHKKSKSIANAKETAKAKEIAGGGGEGEQVEEGADESSETLAESSFVEESTSDQCHAEDEEEDLTRSLEAEELEMEERGDGEGLGGEDREEGEVGGGGESKEGKKGREEGLGLYKCQQCHIYFDNPRSLQIHQKAQHKDVVVKKEEENLECDTCNYQTIKGRSGELGMMSHKRSAHPEVKDYCCKLCGKLFKSNQSLKQHKENIHDKVTYPCTECGKPFRTIQNFKRHRNEVHQVKGEIFSCEDCGKLFKSSQNLKRHMRSLHPKLHEGCEDALLKHLRVKKTNMHFSTITPGKGNCWYHAAADQVKIFGLPGLPTDGKEMREYILDRMLKHPEVAEWRKALTAYEGGLEAFVAHNKKEGVWADGLICNATAMILGHPIRIFGTNHSENDDGFIILETSAGFNEADTFNIGHYFAEGHYQSLVGEQ